jgi:hypothetical protein
MNTGNMVWSLLGSKNRHRPKLNGRFKNSKTDTRMKYTTILRKLWREECVHCNSGEKRGRGRGKEEEEEAGRGACKRLESGGKKRLAGHWQRMHRSSTSGDRSSAKISCHGWSSSAAASGCNSPFFACETGGRGRLLQPLGQLRPTKESRRRPTQRQR